jgi:neutral ceramidase
LIPPPPPRRLWLLVSSLLLAVGVIGSRADVAPAAPATRPATAPAFRAGFAERDITPAIGMEQPGGYVKAFHRVRHDPCKVRAAVFDDGAARVAVVGVDALIVRRPTVDAARRAIAGRCGIPPSAVLIAASHSHSAGPTGMILPGEYDAAPDAVKALAYDQSSCADAAYLAHVERMIVDAVVEADDRRVDARAAAGVGTEGAVAFNRRFHMTGGGTATHPGQGNPDILGPAGPIDPQVGVVGAWAADGTLLGCVVNYACHATTGPGGTSADYVYYIERTIRGLLGEQAVVVFLAGAAGDVTQVDNRSPFDVKQSGEAAARRVGGRVGAEALKVLLSAQAGAGPLAPVAAETRTLQIKRRVPSPARVAAAWEVVRRGPPKGQDRTEWTFAKEVVLLDHRVAVEPVAPVEVQAVQVGPVVLLACPAEYFCQYGLDLKAASKFPFTFPVSLANDCVGYVPTEEALGPGGGGYETRLTSYSNLEPRAGRLIADALLDLAGRRVPGAVPAPPPAPPFKGRPWAYGTPPPELE